MNKAVVSLITLLVVLGIGAVFLEAVKKNYVPAPIPPVSTSTPITPTKPVVKDPAISQRVTLQGRIVCLPHKNTGGFQTMECAFGILADNGLYYALDWSAVDPNGQLNLPMDRKFAVTGLLTPVEAISNDFWQKYNIRGIMKVESYAELGVPKINTDITLRLNQVSVPVLGTTIKVWAVTEDSRCPSDVTCIQAGRVRIGLTIDSPSGSSVSEMQPGQTVTTETLAITLIKVEPHPVSTRKTADGEYRFYFNIKNK